MTKTISGLLRILSLVVELAFLSTSALHASISVTLSPSPAGPQPVGTIITWTATVQDTEQGTHEYQFSVGPANGPLAGPSLTPRSEIIFRETLRPRETLISHPTVREGVKGKTSLDCI